ncbi:hypothetical protein, partial [Mesorhizobium sp. CAU 1741]|uniref:hypothetical protein n=1 Tax=Mesorhizobium sp. CAU 1741 TaxID=3140366 RepID=UPI00325B2CD8
MALPTFPTTEAELIEDTTSDDMLNGGHRTLFFPLLLAALALAEYAQLTGEEIETLAAQTEADAASAAAGSGTEASVANIRAAADVAHYLSMRRVVASQAIVALTDGSTISWDMDAGINVSVTIGAAGRTLANPTNQIAGKSGFLNVAQDGTGGRTITNWG